MEKITFKIHEWPAGTAQEEIQLQGHGDLMESISKSIVAAMEKHGHKVHTVTVALDVGVSVILPPVTKE